MLTADMKKSGLAPPWRTLDQDILFEASGDIAPQFTSVHDAA